MVFCGISNKKANEINAENHFVHHLWLVMERIKNNQIFEITAKLSGM